MPPRLVPSWGPLWLALALIALWVWVPAVLNPGQWGDHFEQFVWAHSMEWGYYKHPPLATWMLAGLIHLFGPSPYWTYLLAALCTAGTAFFTFGLARLLLPAHLLSLSMLLWGLQQAFSSRAQLFNHNAVMMLAISATAWFVLLAVNTRQRRWWWAAGLAAGAAMLSKYQAIVPLAGIAMGLLLTGELLRADSRRGMALALLVSIAVFVPHLVWMVQHDFTTLQYAGQEGHRLKWTDRGLSVVGFLAQQVRLLFPALLFALLLWLLPGLRSDASHHPAPEPDELQRWRRAWFAGLIAFPLVITLLTCPAFGLKLQNHWGYQCLQFVSLWLAWNLRRLALRPALLVTAVALTVQTASFGWMLASSDAQGPGGRRSDTVFPAQALAQAVERDWQRMTPCALKLVVGSSFEAGVISAYSQASPRVLEDGSYQKSPWISAGDIRSLGAVHVASDPDGLPSDALMIDSMILPGSSPGLRQDGDRVYWAIVPPTVCLAGLAGP